ncbi:hypothetical protein J6836_22415 (plasmid) [Providencia sp. R33]|uniref:hypothetical protein n=1 Tax=Providencia sp. R33 TaxID=2828763 RepID=UPI001C5BF425|nr:hypothetical protein [Providencia sp. R33]QXX85114.1 hypothetical protein J6836_22415 [Providencia sp. R33]
MSEKINPRIERDIKRKNDNVVYAYLHVAFFFAAATLFTFYFFNDFLITEAGKPENATWLTAQVQSQLKFAFRCLGELFFVLALSSLSIVFFYMADRLIYKYIQRIKKKFAKIPN